MTPLRIFIGFDERETIAYHVLSHSILSRCSVPVSITPLVQPMLRKCRLYTRDPNPTESTAFAFSRFLVPALCNFEGYALFLDCDFLCKTDLAKLQYRIAWAARETAVWVCPHDYEPKQQTKFLGQAQTSYPRKNWSSFVLFNNAECKALTPEFVNSATGAQLHRFQWTTERQIAHLPLEFNWLVGEYEPNPKALLYHWTNGGPWFEDYRETDHADEWFAERDRMLACSVPSGAVA